MPTQVQIFPDRLLLGDTASEVITKLSKIEEVRQIVVTGPKIPKRVPYGPASGIENPHTERKKIKIMDKETDLEVRVGRIILDLDADKEDIDPIIGDITEICDQKISCDYNIETGQYTKPKPTVTEYMRYGKKPDKENKDK
ncbi:methyl-coenzyme M reductase operon protein D [Methanonatronarchaeum sp. AMET-Sl]|uniref:methyl-coenzyme M reductase operon protein D n=1 Tax=Methanonatronarchaeum sp. AMET-Sl TaxID=3037654 RepID=UPI00244E44C0|nr:methyl-coenzyme M reductase operon protein D [Methanonatronarchaeum sp. AMET-Sl]WGI16694.1 methyl-coenzyme M reductase operon protein D [Methanonatronarchaeum sp. AMET-Sl]